MNNQQDVMGKIGGKKSVEKFHLLGDSSGQFFDNPLWDIHQAAYYLSVSNKTLRDWVYKRQIPFKKVGNLVRFNPSEIQRWIEERSLNHGY